MKKSTYVQRLRLLADKLSEAMRDCKDLHPIYFACGYNIGGENEITIDDLIKAGVPEISAGVPEVSPDDLASLIGLIEQLSKFSANQPVQQGDYATVVNKVRTDA